jgi:hypothetical protein
LALQFSTTWRNAALDLYDTIFGAYQLLRIYSGSPPANCAAANSGTLLVEFDLQSPTWTTAFAGGISLDGITLQSTAVGGAATNAGHFRLYDGAAATCHIQGTITITGGGGDMTAASIAITVGQVINITQFTITATGA